MTYPAVPTSRHLGQIWRIKNKQTNKQNLILSAEFCPLSFTLLAIRALHHPFHQHGGDVSVDPIVARCKALHRSCYQHGGDVSGEPIVGQVRGLASSCHQHGGDVSGDLLWPAASPCIVRAINTAVTYGETPLLARCEALRRSFHQHGGNVSGDPIVGEVRGLASSVPSSRR